MKRLDQSPTLEPPVPYTGKALNLNAFSTMPSGMFHYHSEFELVLTAKSAGQRMIGDNTSAYGTTDLLLLGPNLPHAWFMDRQFNTKVADKENVVVQFTRESLGYDLLLREEMDGVRALLERCHRGLYFDEKYAQEELRLMRSLPHLTPTPRLFTALTILDLLSANEHAAFIASENYRFNGCEQDNARYAHVLSYIHRRSHLSVSLPEAAAEINLSVPAFTRFFRRMSGTSFVDYVQEWRIRRACTLLLATDGSVLDICTAVGFGTPTHFQRQFLLRRGMTARDYRKAHRH